MEQAHGQLFQVGTDASNLVDNLSAVSRDNVLFIAEHTWEVGLDALDIFRVLTDLIEK